MSGSREQVLRAAARLFAERGYAGTSIRDVAASAGVSPAMVMKVAGSKEQLFTAVASFESIDLDGVADADLAATLVRGVVARRDADAPESLTRAVALMLPAPSPEEVRDRFSAAVTAPLSARLGEAKAQEVVALLVGLAVSTRMLGLMGEAVVDADTLVGHWTRLVQQVIDA